MDSLPKQVLPETQISEIHMPEAHSEALREVSVGATIQAQAEPYSAPETPNEPISNPVTDWGYLPVLTLVASVGISLMAAADTAGRLNKSWAPLIFWEGLLILFAPIALRLFLPAPARRERIGLLVVVGVGLFLVKMMHSPTFYTFTDELIHWRTATNIFDQQHLFGGNPLLPVSSYYPGLEISTEAIAKLTGLSIFDAGTIIVFMARIVLVLALYLTFEHISRSARIASLGVLIYMTNNNFVFFSAQFAYESLAFPLAASILFIAVSRVYSPAKDRLGLNFLLLLSLAALLITHHLTSYVLVAFLIVWMVIVFALPYIKVLINALLVCVHMLTRIPLMSDIQAWFDAPRETQLPTTTPILMLVASLGWTISAASLTVAYLAQPLVNGITDFAKMLNGAGTARELFHDFTGLSAPAWERAVGFDAIGLILLTIPIGLWIILRTRRSGSLMLTMVLAAIAYPAVQVLRLNPSAWEIASRLSEFLFIAVALVIAIGLVGLGNSRLMVGFSTFCVSMMLLGGLTAGWPFWARLPGPYLVAADTRSLDDGESYKAAQWVGKYIPPESKLGSDRINRLLMGTYGKQSILTNISGQGNVAFVFMSLSLGISERSFIYNAGLRYLVIDYRLTTGLPVIGIYFERGEPDTYVHRTPLQPQVFAKFEGDSNAARFFDSGNIVIYDIGAMTVEPPQ